MAESRLRKQRTEDEMVRLSVASQIAYFHLAAGRLHPDIAEELEDCIPLAAIALSQVATLYARDRRGRLQPQSALEVEEHLFRPLREGRYPRLENFLVRRDDLRRALITLAEAKRSFGRGGDGR